MFYDPIHGSHKCSNQVMVTYPIIQAPPVTNATTGFRPLVFLGKNRSSLHNYVFVSDSSNHLHIHIHLSKNKYKLVASRCTGNKPIVKPLPVSCLTPINYTSNDLFWEEIVIPNCTDQRKLLLYKTWHICFLETTVLESQDQWHKN